jgi:hypothetical protein
LLTFGPILLGIFGQRHNVAGHGPNRHDANAMHRSTNLPTNCKIHRLGSQWAKASQKVLKMDKKFNGFGIDNY